MEYITSLRAVDSNRWFLHLWINDVTLASFTF